MTADPQSDEPENLIDEARRVLEGIAAISPPVAEWLAKGIAANPSFVADFDRQAEIEREFREAVEEVEELAWFLRSLDPRRSESLDRRRSEIRRDEEAEDRRALSVEPSAEMLALAAAVVIFAKAYLEALGKRAGEATADLPRKVKDLIRARVRKENAPDEIHVGVEASEAVIVVFTRDLPDDARLALLDLDVTAEGLRGKKLRWDTATGEWRALPGLPAAPDKAPASPE